MKNNYLDFDIGDEVFVLGLEQYGTIIAKLNNYEFLVQLGLMKFKANSKSLLYVKKSKKKSYSKDRVENKDDRMNVLNSDGVASYIDLHGMDVEDAILEIDNYLDKAVLLRMYKVTIIHGKGEGILRQRIHKHLKNHKLVKSFRIGDYTEGGLGVTIVYLI